MARVAPVGSQQPGSIFHGSSNVIASLIGRETGATFGGTCEHATGNSRGLWQRMALDSLLVGHRGCVNHVEFNEQGTMLASGSDDTYLRLWDICSSSPQVTQYYTGHAENIFCAKFMPTTSGSTQPRVATCAGDGHVIVHDITSGASQSVFSHHQGRVKKLVTEPGNPYLIISCSEDGTVWQVDTRQPPAQATQLLQLARNGVKSEINSISGPWHKPWLLAVGASDDLLRVYDRRTIGTTAGSRPRATAPKCVAHFTPGSHCESFSSDCITGVAFADDGSQVLANYLGGHVYLWSLDDLASSKPLGSQAAAAAAGAQEVSRSCKRSRQEEQHPATAGGEAADVNRSATSQPQVRRQLDTNSHLAHTAAAAAIPSSPDVMEEEGPRAAAAAAAAPAAAGTEGQDGADSAAPDAGAADADPPVSRVLSVDAALELLERGELRLPRRRQGALASMILNRAQDLYERGEVEASLRYAMTALQLRPNFGMAHYQCAICHEQLGDPAAALAAGEAALQYAWGYDLQQFVRRLNRNMQQHQQQQQQQQHQQSQQQRQQQQQQEQQHHHHHHYQQQQYLQQQHQQQADASRPLPPALQKRLQARGILKSQEESAAAAAASDAATSSAAAAAAAAPSDSQQQGQDADRSGQNVAAVAAAGSDPDDDVLLTAAASGGSESWSPSPSSGGSSSRSAGSSRAVTSSSDRGGSGASGSGSSSGDSQLSDGAGDVATSDPTSSDNDSNHYMLGDARVSHNSSEHQASEDETGSGSSGGGSGNSSEPESRDVVSLTHSDDSWHSDDDDDDDDSTDEDEMEYMLGLDVRHEIYDWGNTTSAAASGSSPSAQEQQHEGHRDGQHDGAAEPGDADRARFGEFLAPLRHQLGLLTQRQQQRLLEQLQQRRRWQQQLSPQLETFLAEEGQLLCEHVRVVHWIWFLAYEHLARQQAQEAEQQQQGLAPTDDVELCPLNVLALLPVLEKQQQRGLQPSSRLHDEQTHMLSAVLFLLDLLPDAAERRQRLIQLRHDFKQTCADALHTLQEQNHQPGQQQDIELAYQHLFVSEDTFLQYSDRLRAIIGDQLDEWRSRFLEQSRLLDNMNFEDDMAQTVAAAELTAAQICRVQSPSHQSQQQQHLTNHAHQPHDGQQQQQQQQQQLQGAANESQQEQQHTMNAGAGSSGPAEQAPSRSQSESDDDDVMHDVMNGDDLLDERDPLICEIGEALAAGERGCSSRRERTSTPPTAAGCAGSSVGPVLLSEHGTDLPGVGGRGISGGAAVGGVSASSRRQHTWSCRYRGHVNLKTVKDVGFVGPGQTMVAAGSDDGRLYVWDRWTGELVTALRADRYVVNCVAGHPNLPVMASCGIDNTVKLWTPCLDRPRELDHNMFYSLGYNEIERSAESFMMYTGPRFNDMCKAFSRQRAEQLLMQIRHQPAR